MSSCENLGTLEYSSVLLAVRVTSPEFPKIVPRNHMESALHGVRAYSSWLVKEGKWFSSENTEITLLLVLFCRLCPSCPPRLTAVSFKCLALLY